MLLTDGKLVGVVTLSNGDHRIQGEWKQETVDVTWSQPPKLSLWVRILSAFGLRPQLMPASQMERVDAVIYLAGNVDGDIPPDDLGEWQIGRFPPIDPGSDLLLLSTPLNIRIRIKRTDGTFKSVGAPMN